ncbi:MAG: hypothetical protein V4613_03035 [Bacteroidota bacterium]
MRKLYFTLLFIASYSIGQAQAPWYSNISFGPGFGGVFTFAKPDAIKQKEGLKILLQPGFTVGATLSYRKLNTYYELGLDYVSEGYSYTYQPLANSFESLSVKQYKSEIKYYSIQMPLSFTFPVHEGVYTTQLFGFSVTPKYLLKQIDFNETEYKGGAKERDVIKSEAIYPPLNWGLNINYAVEIPILYDYSLRISPYILFSNFTSEIKDRQVLFPGFGIKNTFFIHH